MSAKNIFDNRICLFDKSLIDLEKTTAIHAWHQPHPEKVVCEFEKPWEGESGFTCILREDGKFKAYYEAGQRLNEERNAYDADNTFVICYKESVDGENWVKPNLGIIEYKGSKDNNIVFDKPVEFFVLHDTNPNCKKGQEYKAIYHYPGKQQLFATFSQDGLHFNGEVMISDKAFFDTLNVCLYDEEKQTYIAYVRGMHRKGGGEFDGLTPPEVFAQKLPFRRDIKVMFSKDFINWSDPQPLDMEIDPNYEIYTNCITRYYNAPNYLIGFPMRYFGDATDWSDTYENFEEKNRAERHIRMNVSKRFGLATTDCIMIFSDNDYVKFNQSQGSFLTAGVENQYNWVYGDCSPVQNGIFESENKLFGTKEMTFLCHDRKWSRHERLIKYTMRIDGFASFGAREEAKKLVTKPFIFDGNELRLNVATSAKGKVFVNITADGKSIKSNEILGDHYDKKVSFESDLSEFAGKEVVMTIDIEDAKVYSFKFNKI